MTGQENESRADAAAETTDNPERREIIGRMLKLAAAAPMAALLFDPNSARAGGESVITDPEEDEGDDGVTGNAFNSRLLQHGRDTGQ